MGQKGKTMNRTNKRIFDNIKAAEAAYNHDAEAALMEYAKQKRTIEAEAAKLKDETTYRQQHLAEAKQAARLGLKRAEDQFRSTVRTAREDLNRELKAAIKTVIPAGFSEAMKFYRDTGLTPSKTETEALLETGGKSLLAVQAVAKLLDDLGAPIRVDAPTVASFEADVAELDELAAGPLFHAPDALHSEAVEIMRGTPKPTWTAAGWRDVGEMWDQGVEVIAQRVAVLSRLQRILDRENAWSSDVTCELREREHEDAVKIEKEVAEITGENISPDEPESTVTITDAADDAAIEVARELGRRDARPDIPAQYVR